MCMFRLCLVAEERMVGIAGKISHIEDSLGILILQFKLLHLLLLLHLRFLF